MSKEELFNTFAKMFPDWARCTICYRKIGSKALLITFKNFGESLSDPEEHSTRVFLWIDENNWQFGTKLWRKRPEKVKNDDHFKYQDPWFGW